MKPLHSRMDDEVYIQLHLDGYKPMRDITFTVGIDPVTGRKEHTTPDLWFPREWIPWYIDGVKVHLHKQEHDCYLREKLSQKYGVPVYASSYERFSPLEALRILDEIKQVIPKVR